MYQYEHWILKIHQYEYWIFENAPVRALDFQKYTSTSAQDFWKSQPVRLHLVFENEPVQALNFEKMYQYDALDFEKETDHLT